MKAFYLNATTNNWELVKADTEGLIKLPAGSCTLVANKEKTIVWLYEGTQRIGMATITDLIKNITTGAKYTDWADFDTATSNFFVKAPSTGGADIHALTDRVTYLENHAYDTLRVDYWQIPMPSNPLLSETWYNATDSVKSWNGTGWSVIPISFYSQYLKVDALPVISVWSWSGSTLVQISQPIDKTTVETLIGTNPTHNHFNQLRRTVALTGFDIVLTAGEDFTKLTGMATPSTFTINVAGLVLKKQFRLFLTGGTLALPTFTGYTTHWLASTAVTDYVPATNPNVLYCEIREANHIYLFWGE
jgi:hypothetical protein